MFHFPTSQSIIKMEPSDQSGMVWGQEWHQFGDEDVWGENPTLLNPKYQNQRRSISGFMCWLWHADICRLFEDEMVNEWL